LSRDYWELCPMSRDTCSRQAFGCLAV